MLLTTEGEAQDLSTTEIRRLLTSATLIPPEEAKRLSYDDVWLYLRDAFHYDMIDPLSSESKDRIKTLLRTGALKMLLDVLFGSSHLNRVCQPYSFSVSRHENPDM